jgi:hypothetical protein
VEGGFGSVPGTTCEEVLDSVAGLETHGGAVLPPGDGTPLGVHEALLKDVVEDVLEVEDVDAVADVKELSGGLLVSAGRLVVGDPELGSLDLRAARWGGHVCIKRKNSRGWSAGKRGETRRGDFWRIYGGRTR